MFTYMDVDVLNDAPFLRRAVEGNSRGPDEPTVRFTVKDAIVLSRLVDFHGHYDPRLKFSVNPVQAAYAQGLHTVVDAGSAGPASAGALLQLRDSALPTVAMKAFLHCGHDGLLPLNHGDSDMTGQRLSPASVYKEFLMSHSDFVVGVKIRLARGMSMDPARALEHAIEVASEAELPLMLHLTDEVLPLDFALSKLRGGDVYTHMYHSRGEAITNAAGVRDAVVEARRRGILFDLGHGGDLFDGDVATVAASQAFWPDFLGTDASYDPPIACPSLVDVMSLMLHIGMPADSILHAASTAPHMWLYRGGSEGVSDDIDMALARSSEPIAIVRLGEGRELTNQRCLSSGREFELLVARSNGRITVSDSSVHSVLNHPHKGTP